MIKLNSTIDKFKRYTNPPTHALCTSKTVIWQPWESGVKYVHFNYTYGKIEEDKFVPDFDFGPIEVKLPSMEFAMQTGIDATVPADNDPTSLGFKSQMTIVESLLLEGVAPSKDDPTEMIEDANKKAGEFANVHADALFAKVFPALEGEVI